MNIIPVFTIFCLFKSNSVNINPHLFLANDYEDDELIKTQNLKVYKFTKENKNKDVHINEYTKYDPTLPHMQTIKCPNVSCKSNEESNSLTQDVIYMRYDDKNMKYMYLCCHCNFNWFP